MKFALIAFLSFSASQSLALDNLCATKQKNAASFKLAQEIGVPVQGAQVTRYSHGVWSEAVGENVGSDQVTIRIGNRINRAMTIKTYEVFAKQIGTGADCNVLEVVEVR